MSTYHAIDYPLWLSSCAKEKHMQESYFLTYVDMNRLLGTTTTRQNKITNISIWYIFRTLTSAAAYTLLTHSSHKLKQTQTSTDSIKLRVKSIEYKTKRFYPKTKHIILLVSSTYIQSWPSCFLRQQKWKKHKTNNNITTKYQMTFKYTTYPNTLQ